MLDFLKSLFYNLTFRLGFLVVLIMAVFGYSEGHFIFVRADTDQINVFPGNYVYEQENGAADWSGAEKCVSQDLSPQAELGDFNKDNSAYIIFGEPAAVSTSSEEKTSESMEIKDEIPATSTEPAKTVESSEANGPAQESPSDGANNEDVKNNNGGNSLDKVEEQNAPRDGNSDEIKQEQPAPVEITVPKQEENNIIDAPPENINKETSSFIDNLLFVREKINSLFSGLFNLKLARADDEASGDKIESSRTINNTSRSIIFSDFNLPPEKSEKEVETMQLRISFAGQSGNKGDKLGVFYNLDGQDWQEAGNILLDKKNSNALNGGYFLFGMPIIKSQEEIKKLKIKIGYFPENGSSAGARTEIYLDSLWLEINYKDIEIDPGISPGSQAEPEKEAAEINAEDENSFEFKMMSELKDFELNNEPVFKFSFKKKRTGLSKVGAGILSLFYDEYKKFDIKAKLESGQEQNSIQPVVKYIEDGEFTVEMPKVPRQFRPGKHKIEVTISDDETGAEKPLVFEQDFTWGVLAFNASKSIYLPGENSYLQMAVLDDRGNTICDANVSLEITAPDGGIAYLNTDNGLIVSNPECGPNNVIYTPDYYAHYGLAETGIYKVKMTALTENGNREISDEFEVRDYVPFDIERIGPTRIYPKADYEIKYLVSVNEDYRGEFKEYVPSYFDILDTNGGKIEVFDSETREISWDVDWKAGEFHILRFSFDPPDVSPEFYLLGPAKIGDFSEARAWQIASDAVIEHYTVRRVAQQTTTTNGWTYVSGTAAAGTSLSANGGLAGSNFTVGETYLIMIWGYHNNSNAGNQSGMRILHNGTVFTESQSLERTDQTGVNNKTPYFWFNVWTAANESIDAQFYRGGNTSRIENVTFSAINVKDLIGNGDLFYNITTSTKALTTTPTSTASVFWKPLSDNNAWWVGGYTRGDIISTAGQKYNIYLDLNGAAHASSSIQGMNGADYPLYGFGWTENLSNTATHTAKIMASESAADEQFAAGGIFALRLNAFNEFAAYSTSSPQTLGGSTGVWVTLNSTSSTSFLPSSSGDWITAGGFIAFDNNGQVQGQMRESAIGMNSIQGGWSQNNTTDYIPYTAGTSTVFSTSTKYVDIQARYGNGADPDPIVYDAWITAFSMDLSATSTQAPTGLFNSATTSSSGGTAYVSIKANDANNDNLKAKFEYATSCASTFFKATINTNDASTTADFGDPKIDNGSAYQIGTTTGWILTASGLNNIDFLWDASTDLPAGEGNYCIKLTVNDGSLDQSEPATTTVAVDSYAPPPGALSFNSAGSNNIKLNLGASSTEINFTQYKIFYSTTSPVMDSGAGNYEFSSSTSPGDPNLGVKNYNSATTTDLTGLESNTAYYINIWAYDSYGHKASSTQITATTTNNSPVITINTRTQRTDGTGVIDFNIWASDLDGDDARAKMEYVSYDGSCNWGSTNYAELDENPASYDTSNGTLAIDNESAGNYQIGSSTGWIKTSPAGTTTIINFDWLSKNDLPDAEGQYCVKITGDDFTMPGTPATTIFTIDNKAPTVPGQMSLENISPFSAPGASVLVTFGATSSDPLFREYKIFYKKGTSSVTEADTAYDSSDDPDLEFADFNGATSTTIEGLDPNTDYVFNIWAYDDNGNKSSSTEVTITTGDAASIRANTVEFLAGTPYTSNNGTNGQNSDTDNTLPVFNFQLAENGLALRNAYIILDAQFAAYTTADGDYSSSTLAFDSCSGGSCTPDAFGGSGNVVIDDPTVLAYDEGTGHSNHVRLMFDVTNEAELASYAGNSGILRGQVGYNFKRSGALNSIANAKAILAVTYSYNEELSPRITKTVYYPLESSASGDLGTRRANITGSCAKGTTCPRFNYRMDLPEFGVGSEKISQWFRMFTQSDNPSSNGANDLNIYASIGGGTENSAVIHENAMTRTQGNLPVYFFSSVSGYGENSSQYLEYRIQSGAGNGFSYYLIGGEVAETFIASSSDSVKTRTVSFPLGALNNGATTAKTNKAVNVYFPENGNGSGKVTIKKAWFRIISSEAANGASTISVSSKVGSNAESSASVYNFNLPGARVVKPSFNIVHVASSSEYSELAGANISSPKAVTLYTTNSALSQGGVSAELMITYTYTDEFNGYLTSLNLFAGQSATSSNSRSTTTPTAKIVSPEIIGTKTMRAASLLASYHYTDSGQSMPTATFNLDANISTGTPSCASAYDTPVAGTNSFVEFYKDVASVLAVTDNQSYNACYANDGGGLATAGAKMNGALIYTYQWNAVQPYLTEKDWRWYDNADVIVPINPKADENTGISNINLGDILRLRMNIGVTEKNMATSTQVFNLQFAMSDDCSSSSLSWTDVGATSSSAVWRGYDNPGAADGSTAATTTLASSTVFETYESANSSGMNPKSALKNSYPEWDWVLYNNSATSSSQYCFRMAKSDGTALDEYDADGYARLTTAASNTPPADAESPGQFKTDGLEIANQSWISTSSVKLSAAATDVNISERIALYFQLVYSTSTFETATSQPASWCFSDTSYNSCASKIWVATSTLGDYRTSPFYGTTTITGIPDSISTSTGYKWQVLACDDSNVCADHWEVFSFASPNFKVDTLPPSSPGAFTFSQKSATSVTLNFGSSTQESNFNRYRIFYKQGSAGVAESDTEKVDSNLDYIDFNGAATTTFSSLSANTQYVFNIWAYDLAGNKASATPEFSTTTDDSIQPPTLSISSRGQVSDIPGGIKTVILVDDPDNNDTIKVKVEYATSSSGICNFSLTSKAYIDTADEDTYAYIHGTQNPSGDPKVDNSSEYQVGTTTGYILTSAGPSDVIFHWLSKNNIGTASGYYCLKITANDGTGSGDVTATTTPFFIDNTPPAIPAAMSFNFKKSGQIKLNLNSPFSSDNSVFQEYKIFYSTTSPASENGTEFSSSTTPGDPSLGWENYNGATTTLISSLSPGTAYYFNIWAYDIWGNSASSTQISTTTNLIPEEAADAAQFKNDGITSIANGGWTGESSFKMRASVNDADTLDVLSLYFQLAPTASSTLTATTVPASYCVDPDYISCSDKVWLATSSAGDYSVTPFTATTTVTGIPDSAAGYKWQVLACDNDGECSNSWTPFDASTPNFKVDSTAPGAFPNALANNSVTSGSVDLSLLATTSENNFSEYRIYYKAGASGVTESDTLFGTSSDSNLDDINFNGATLTSISGLSPSMQYVFNIWAYDLAGNKASSTEVTATTDAAVSTPGVLFYTKNSRVLYYKIWDVNSGGWSNENTGPVFGSGAGTIRHVRAVRSDDGGKVGIVLKIYDTAGNPDLQEFWGGVYRVAANDFVSTTSLGTANSNSYEEVMNADIAALSGGEFFVVRPNDSAGDLTSGTKVYRWRPSDGWVSQSNTPSPGANVAGVRLFRRPGTDNHVLTVLDANPRVKSTYYSGGANYSDNWSWPGFTDHSGADELSAYYFQGEMYFNPGDNTKGALSYTGSNTANYTKAKSFTFSNTTMTEVSGSATSTPAVWGNYYANGMFAADPGGSGVAYFAGRDSAASPNSNLSVLKIDNSSGSPIWSTSTNGTNTAGGTLYNYGGTNYSYLPFSLEFYKNGKGTVIWADNGARAPYYRIITASTNSLSASSTVPGATTTKNFIRVKTYKDPNENEFLAVFQSAAGTNNIDFGAVFWDGASDRFYSTSTNPGSNQVWTDIAVSAGGTRDDERAAYVFTKRNSSPGNPSSLIQYKGDASTTIANAQWISSSTVVLKSSAADVDTQTTLNLFFQLATSTGNFISSTSKPSSWCNSGTAFSSCSSKIWAATSSQGDYSVTAYAGTTTITSIPDSPDSSSGYAWQVIACDEKNSCSGWIAFNPTAPNFKVDVNPPTSPGQFSIVGKNSTSITLGFGASTTEQNFDRYRIYYSTSSPVDEFDMEHLDNSKLLYQNFNGATSTTVINLNPDTVYYFNIWAYDLAGNKASSSNPVSTSTNSSYFLSQVSYLFENDDGSNVNGNTAAAAIATQLNSVPKGQRINARFQIENTGGDVASSKSYKLQYQRSDIPGVWDDAGPSAEINYSSGLSGNNGDIIASNKAGANSNTPSWTGTWHEGTNITGGITLNSGYYTELAFALHTGSAVLGKTYYLRLYNNTDGKVMDGYTATPTISMIASETKRHSKNAVSSLAADVNPLTYFLDKKGYDDVLSDDSARDSATSTSNIPVFNFTAATSTNTQALNAVWNGQSTVGAGTNNIFLQVYRFGSTNAWVTVATNTSAAADTDFDLSANVNSSLSEYYYNAGGYYLVYWRAYQSSGSQTLKTDYFNFYNSAPTPEANQIHYRWRNDNGSESAATWSAAEDTGTSSLAVGSTTRLRFAVSNTGGGAANYSYRIEYATTSSNCLTDPGGWNAVATSTGPNHFKMAASTYFSDGASTTKQMSDPEGYTFATGTMVEDPSNITSAISVSENRYTEIEFAVTPTASSTLGGTYCFRVTDSGASLEGYSKFAEITLAGVTNTAPSFTFDPADYTDVNNIINSSSSTPTNYGSDVTFLATAADTENDDYYLAVCKTNSVSPGNDAPPTCGGGSWCVSGAASSTVEAGCTYATATTSEELAWYAFVCDKLPGAGVAKCSPMSQGDTAEDSGSPFNINHPPVFSSIITSVNYQDPGGAFTITSASSDTDVSGEADTLSLYVCSTASFIPGSGCGATTICSTIGTSSPNASCGFSIPIPTAAGTTTYYAFIFDNHDMAASDNYKSSSYTVNNISPSLGTLILNGGTDINLNIRPNTTTVQTVMPSLSDKNGCSDIISATAVYYMSATTSDCGGASPTDYNVCYSTSNCIIGSCDGDGITTSFTCSTDFKYYASPTDDFGGNPNEPYNWLSKITIRDNFNIVSTSSTGRELTNSRALDIAENTINFGDSLFAGQDTGLTNQQTTIINSGNSPINNNVRGTDMTGNPAGSILVGNIKWSLTGFNYPATGTPLTSGNYEAATHVKKATSSTDSIKPMYWGIFIPYGSPTSIYSGLNTFEPVTDASGW